MAAYVPTTGVTALCIEPNSEGQPAPVRSHCPKMPAFCVVDHMPSTGISTWCDRPGNLVPSKHVRTHSSALHGVVAPSMSPRDVAWFPR